MSLLPQSLNVSIVPYINVREYRRGNTIMDSAQKLAAQGTQDEDKHNTICVGHHYEQINTNNVNNT